MAYDTTTTQIDTPGLGVRTVLALVGVAGMVVAPFLAWTNGAAGVNVGIQAFWRTTPNTSVGFFSSAGVVMIALGLIAVLSLAARSGWLTRLAGALGLIAMILFGIEVYRSGVLGTFEIGAWLAAIGSLVVLFAGLFGGSRTTTTTTAPAPPAPPYRP
jgi:hypothetical protein